MNVSSIKTPGVYINEIDAFPQSVAQVATAIPAFVGYTEKGPTTPTRIVSLLEYKQLFGGGPQPSTISIALDANNQPTQATNAAESKFNLYNSLQLFYANGGGECYIVSVGSYASGAIKDTELIAGLDSLRNYDEPTLLLFPDAVDLPAAQLGNVQKAALLQCEELMDRFVIMDVKHDNTLSGTDGQKLAENNLRFRDGVGINSLKYGAAYYPYLVSSFNEYQFSYDTINSSLPANSKFSDLYPGNANIAPFNTMLTLVKAYNTAWNLPANQTKKDSFASIGTKSALATAVGKTTDLLKIYADAEGISGSDNFKTFVKNDLITQRLKPLLSSIMDFGVEYNDKAGTKMVIGDFNLSGFDTNWGALATLPAATSPTNPFSGKLTTSGNTDWTLVTAEYNALHAKIVAALNASLILVNKYQSIQETALLPQLPLFATISAKLNQSMNTTPPSGAVAGSYAQTDATRGVWKAPANLSLNGIIGLTDDINDLEQEPMNIHETGKSINAIRKFTGKGFLVWGARTLDGNSNDWRYVNVRRLAIMIEESVKKLVCIMCLSLMFR